VDGGDGGLAGEVFEGEERAETARQGFGFGGEGFPEGEDGGIDCRRRGCRRRGHFLFLFFGSLFWF